MLDPVDLGGAFSAQSGQNIRTTSTDIGNKELRSPERRWTPHNAAMHMLFFSETTGNFAEALGIEANMSAHPSQCAGIAKTILINRLMHHRDALGLGQQD